MFALESAMDELADRLRHRPDRAAGPQRARRSIPRPGCRSARATSSPACARAPSASAGTAATRRPACAARAAGWSAPASPRSTYPGLPARRPGARATADADGTLHRADRRRRHRHRRPHRAHPDRRRRARRRRPSACAVEIGDSALPARRRRRRLDRAPRRGARPCHGRVPRSCRGRRRHPAEASSTRRERRRRPAARGLRRHAFGAQFAEVRVDADTGEVRVPRMLGVFAAGRIINPLTARSQFVGGMTMGLVHGAARGERPRRRVRRLRQPRPRRLPRRRPRRRRATSRRAGSTRTTPTSTRWAPRASARSASSAPRRRSPTRSTTRPASASATCPCASTTSSLPAGDSPLYLSRRRAKPHRARRGRANTPT